MKILIAVDGSEYTKKAVDYLIEHKAVFGDQPELSCIHVSLTLPPRAASAVGKEMVQAYYADETKAASDTALKKLAKAGMTAKLIAKVGHPGDEIAKAAEKGKFDMVIMGSHGHGTFKNLIMGSVATKVLANCQVPVLLIR